jgi:hypothetical protein
MQAIGKLMTHYTINNFWQDSPIDDLPKVKTSIVSPSDMIDTFTSEIEGQVVYYSIVSGDVKLSAETHKERKERVERPVILVTHKPAKRHCKPAVGHVAYYQSDANNSGDYIRETSSKPAILAGNERGERSPSLGNKVRVKGNAEPIPYK